MLPPGSGFFAMWNGIAPEHAQDFALMYTRDHLAEHMSYLGEDGFLWARRFGSGLGTLPPNFAWYAMPALDRLVDPAFAGARVHETAWFQAIRPHYRDRIAHHCRVVGSAGAGTGSTVATFLLTLAPGARDPGGVADDAVQALTSLPPVTAAHLAIVDWTVPIRVGGVPPTPGAQDDGLGALVVEGFDRLELAAALAAVAQAVVESGVAASAGRHGHYGLSYALNRREVGDLHRFRRDDVLAAARLRDSGLRPTP